MGYIEFGRDDYDRAMTYFDRINPQSEFYDHALYYKSYIAYAREQYDLSLIHICVDGQLYEDGRERTAQVPG